MALERARVPVGGVYYVLGRKSAVGMMRLRGVDALRQPQLASVVVRRIRQRAILDDVGADRDFYRRSVSRKPGSRRMGRADREVVHTRKCSAARKPRRPTIEWN